MFVVVTVMDVIRLPPSLLSAPSFLSAIHGEIDLKYPNRVLPDVGLVVCRYGDCLSVSHGVCVAGDGGSHHECKFRIVVFRPFVEEVCLGTVSGSNADGVSVRLGQFFSDVFIPAYWMLRPSRYEEKTGLWVWTPEYDDDEGGEGEEGGDGDGEGNGAAGGGDGAAKAGGGDGEEQRGEGQDPVGGGDGSKEEAEGDGQKQEGDGGGGGGGNRFEMELGAEIRFKVKSINFTQITNTAKGVQATTSTTAHCSSSQAAAASSSPPGLNIGSGGAEEGAASGGDAAASPSAQAAAASGAAGDGGASAPASAPDGNVPSAMLPVRRRRSSSVGIVVDETRALPAAMHIVASICEDGLGLTSWWTGDDEEPDDGENNDGQAAGGDAEEPPAGKGEPAERLGSVEPKIEDEDEFSV